MMKGSLKFLRKKLCVIGLVIASVFAGVAAPMAVSTANVEVAEAGTNGYTREQAVAWAKGRIGVRDQYCDLDGNGIWCVDLIMHYYQTLGQLRPSGNAYEYKNDGKNHVPNGWKRYGNNVRPEPGDVVVWDRGAYGIGGNSYGHIGIVIEVNGDSFKYVDYRKNTIGAPRTVTGINRFTCLIRPDFPAPYDPWENELKGKEVRIEDGYYVIQSRLGYSEHNLDVAGAGTAHGTNIGIWNAFGAHSGQIFKVFRTYYDSYAMESLNTGRYVSTENDTVGAANCILGDGNGSKGQHFKLFDAGDGFVYVSNNHKYFLDIYNANNTMGNNVQLWKYNGSDAQKWKFTRVSGCKLVDIPEGDYLIYSKVKNRVLNVNANKVENGSNINIYDPFTPTTPQGRIFTVSKDGNFATKIINKAANRSIDTDGNHNQSGGNVILWDSNKNYGQNWYIEDAGDGYVYIRNLWGYYLDIDHDSSGAYENGRNVQVWSFHGQDNEKWKLVRYYAVTGVNLNTANMTLTEGTTGQLTATISPSNANNKNLSWSSSNTSVATVDNIGKVTAVKAGTAVITAKAEDNGTTATCTVTVKSPKNDRFSDVSQNDWYYKSVEWAAAKGIATGSNGKFFPTKACTREEAITFLWRMQGKPTPKSMKSKYSDVKDKNRYSYKAIMWGTEKGVITGKNGKFLPKRNCTREQIVAMIWRLAGKPSPSSMTSKFSDVKDKNSYSYKAILWANQKGITTGGSGKFYPASKCKRCDIITFIYRYKN